MNVPPMILRFVSGSAVGYYGNRGDEPLTESSAPGEGFLTDVVLAWEASAAPAVDAGASVALARTGIVLARQGGAMERLLQLARFGLAGPLGSGKQYWPCLLYTSDAADERSSVDLGGRRIIKKKKNEYSGGTNIV